MAFILPSHLYKWLNHLGLVNDGKKIQQNQIQIPKYTTDTFLVGLSIASLIRIVSRKQPNYKDIVYNFESLRENSTPAIKLYNWNILVQSLKKQGIIIFVQSKKQILQGDLKALLMVLQKIYQKYAIQQLQQQQIQFRQNSLEVNISNLSSKKTLSQCRNILEFCVISLSKNLKVSLQHSLNLFSENNKYLSHLLVKGVKGSSFQNILDFFNDISMNGELIVTKMFVDSQKQSIQFLFNALKAALISKQQDVVMGAIKIYFEINIIYKQKGLDNNLIKKWIINEGINSFLFSIKRHQNLSVKIIQQIIKLIQTDIFNIVSPQYKNPVWTTYQQFLQFLHLFLTALSTTNHNQIITKTYLEFQKSPQIQLWINLLLNLTDADHHNISSSASSHHRQIIRLYPENQQNLSNKSNNTLKMKLIGLGLLQKIWEVYQIFFQKHQKKLPNAFVNSWKDIISSNFNIIQQQQYQYTSYYKGINILFNLMTKFGKQRKNIAAYIYKTLTGIFQFFSQNSTQINEKVSYLISNFQMSFTELNNLPASPILSILLKKMKQYKSINQQILNLCRTMIQQQKITNSQRIQLIDSISKIIMNNNIYAEFGLQIMKQLLHNQQFEGQLIETSVNICKIGLSMFYGHHKNIRKMELIHKDYQKHMQNPKTANKPINKSLLQQLKLYLTLKNIFHLLQIFLLEFQDLHPKMEVFLSHTYLQLKKPQQNPNQNNNKHKLHMNRVQQSNIKDSVLIFHLLRIIHKDEAKTLESLKKYSSVQNQQNQQNSVNKVQQHYNIEEQRSPGDTTAVQPQNDKNMIQHKQRYAQTPKSRRNKVRSMMISRFNNNNDKNISNSYDVSTPQLDLQYMNPNIGLRAVNIDKSQQFGNEIGLMDLSLIKPTKRALKQLQQIKIRRQQVRLKSEQQHIRKKEQKQRKQKKAKNIRQIRQLQFGISKQRDGQINCIYEWGSLKQETNIQQIGLPQIRFIDLNEQQQLNKLTVIGFMKKFKRVWRFLFYKYSSNGMKDKQALSIFKKQQKIHISQLWKIIKDYKLATHIKKDQLQTFIRLINQKYSRKSDLFNLMYPAFQQFIFQFSVEIYSRNIQKGLKYAPYIYHLKIFLNQLKKITAQNHANTQLFQNPQNVYFQQSDVIKQFNKQLNINHKYILPQGYKKVLQTTTNLQYNLTNNSNIQNIIPQPYIVSLQIFNQIFQNIFQVHIIQPNITITQTYRAKPVIFQSLTQKIKLYKQGYLQPKKYTQKFYQDSSPLLLQRSRSKQSRIKQIQKTDFHPNIKFSLGIKLGISFVNPKDKYIGQQVAYWMDDMLDAVVNGYEVVGNKGKRMIVNEYNRHKKQKEQLKKRLSLQLDRRLHKRHESIKQQVKRLKQQSIIKRLQQNTIKKKQQQQNKKKQQRLRNQHKKIREIILIRKREQQQKLKKQQQQRRIIRIKKEQEYKKSIQEYFNKKRQQFNKQQQQKKKKRLQQQQRIKKKQQQQLKKQAKLYLKILKQDQQVIHKNILLKNQYIQLYHKNQNIQLLQKSYQNQIILLFHLLYKYQKSNIHNLSLDNLYNHKTISFTTFNLFAVKFRIVPFLIHKNTLHIIYHSIHTPQQNQNHMNINKFKQALFKIAVKAKNILNQLHKTNHKQLQTIIPQSNTSQINHIQQNNTNIINPPKQKTNLKVSKRDKLLLTNQYTFDASGVDQKTLLALYKLLKLGEDKQQMQVRFREALQSKAMPTNTLAKQMKKMNQINQD